MALAHHTLIAWQRAEVGYCIDVAQRLGYLSEDVAGELELEIRKVGALLAGPTRPA